MKQKLQDLKAYIKVLEKNRIVKWIAVFIAVMIILTIGSRVTYNIITPKVLTEPAASAVIDHSADIEGVVTSVSEEPVILEAGLLVTRVIVMEGQLIKKGDTLLEIDKESLNRIIPSLQGAELSRYTAIKAAGGKVKSSCSGMVSRVNAETGSYTLGNAAVVIRNADKGLAAKAVLDNETGKYINSNTAVSVAGSSQSCENLKISSIISRAEDNMREVYIKLPKGEFALGESVSLHFDTASDFYENCVPRSAVRMDNKNSCYVLTVREEQTILGEELITVKTDVTLLDCDMNYAAVEGIHAGQEVIVSSERVIEEGIKVRRLQ